MKAAVISQNGLGDGFISLVLSENLRDAGFEVDTFHGSMDLLSRWVPHHHLKRYPSPEEVSEFLNGYDAIYVFYSLDYPFVEKVLRLGKIHHPDKVKIIYPYPTRSVRREPYYSDSPIKASLSFVRNIAIRCKAALHLKNCSHYNGIVPPEGLVHRKYPRRVALHVRSSKVEKDWPIEKFMEVADRLKERGYAPYFIIGEEKHRKLWLWLIDKGYELPRFDSLDEVATAIYESGFLIGIDSGFGHMASSMHIPAVVIGRKASALQFWRPDWGKTEVVTPPWWIPNLKWFRWRDKNWKKLITVRSVLKAFDKLIFILIAIPFVSNYNHYYFVLK